MYKKKLMILGGGRFLVPVIEQAHRLNLYVITCDYLPENIAHKYSDEYVNVSIVDKECVLSAAKTLGIDGIMSFACDPGVITAAYVAEKLNLPFQCSYESACILQNKSKFRTFLKTHGFNTPIAYSATSVKEAYRLKNRFDYPIIVKPADSAGSKGVSKVECEAEYDSAVNSAFSNSLSKTIIVEEYLDLKGYQSSTDMFTINGSIVHPIYSDQYFDTCASNPFVPTVESWPSTMSKESQDELTEQLNRLFKLLRCQNGIYNIECRVCSNNKTYIMEVSPRGGGNHIALAQDMIYGFNYIENEIRNVVGLPLAIRQGTNDMGYWCIYTIHSKGTLGVFKGITFNTEIQEKTKFIDLGIEAGNRIEPFTGANQAVGDIVLRFDTKQELEQNLSDTSKWLSIHTDKKSE